MPRPRPALQLVHDADAGEPAGARPAALDDNELVAAVRAGDESAATTLHDRLRPRIEATICRMLGRRDVEHDDLVQTALIEIVQSIDRYRGECSLESWASTITAHMVYNTIRRRKLERRIFDSGEQRDVTSPASTSRLVVARDYVRRLRVHLDDMDEAKAWTFLLHDVCGFDLREIAQITGVSAAAAQTRLVRGRREMHERIAADPELADMLAAMEVES
jgi:RNA polymerase sigma-70 factor (ECF subfamily)